MKKTILFVDHDPVHSGSTVSLEYVVRAFVQAGFTAFVHTPKRGEAGRAFRTAGAQVLVYRSPFIRTLGLSTSFLNNAFPLSPRGIVTGLKDLVKGFWGIVVYLRAIKQCRAQLVYVNEHTLLQASIAARLSGVPCAIHLRSRLVLGLFGWRRALISSIILNFNDHIFAITNQEAEQLNPSRRFATKISVVGEFFNRSDARSGSGRTIAHLFKTRGPVPAVVMLGGIQRIKGSADFLKAAELILAARSTVVVVLAGSIRTGGDNEERSHFLECRRLEERVRRTGRYVNLGEVDDPLNLVRSSTVVVASATESHFARPVVEAWGCGKPVVATDTAHHAALIEDGTNGLLVPVGDHRRLAEAVVRLLDDPRLRRTLAVAGRRRVSEAFDAERNTSTIVRVCSSLLPNPGSAAR